MSQQNLGSHIFRQFDQELEGLRNRVLTMGGLVEEQLGDALTAFFEGDSTLAETVIERDREVNGMEVRLDEECARILAIRQPAAGDLRLIFAIIKTITDLERIGDQADRVARAALETREQASLPRSKDHKYSIRHLGDQVHQMLRDALDAFARMDVERAREITRQDKVVDNEYESIMRQLITHMMEDPRSIRGALDSVWAARALERIGDHTKNLCEYLIYMVEGTDVRHVRASRKDPAGGVTGEAE